MTKPFPIVLTAVLAISWWIGASGQGSGWLTLAGLGTVVTFPYFVWAVFKQVMGGKIVVGCLVIIALCIPILQVLVAIALVIWMIASMIAKFARFQQYIPFMLGGVGVYVVTWLVPPLLHGITSFIGLPDVIASILAAGGGGAAFWLILAACEEEGLDPSLTGALLLGFGGYIVLFVLTLWIATDGDAMDVFTDDGPGTV